VAVVAIPVVHGHHNARLPASSTTHPNARLRATCLLASKVACSNKADAGEAQQGEQHFGVVRWCHTSPDSSLPLSGSTHGTGLHRGYGADSKDEGR